MLLVTRIKQRAVHSTYTSHCHQNGIVHKIALLTGRSGTPQSQRLPRAPLQPCNSPAPLGFDKKGKASGIVIAADLEGIRLKNSCPSHLSFLHPLHVADSSNDVRRTAFVDTCGEETSRLSGPAASIEGGARFYTFRICRELFVCLTGRKYLMTQVFLQQKWLRLNLLNPTETPMFAGKIGGREYPGAPHILKFGLFTAMGYITHRCTCNFVLKRPS